MTQRRGLFGAPMADPTAMAGAGVLPGETPSFMPDQANLPALPQQKPGFFARNGVGVQILGGLSDGVLAATGGRPVFGPAMDARRQREQALADEQRQLAQQYGLIDYKAQHAPPPAPHYWETNDGSLAMVGPDGKPQVLYKDPTPKINWITADNGDGTKSMIPVGPNGPMTAQQPQAAGGGQLPQGFTVRKSGGAAPSGPGGFPLYPKSR